MEALGRGVRVGDSLGDVGGARGPMSSSDSVHHRTFRSRAVAAPCSAAMAALPRRNAWAAFLMAALLMQIV